MVMNILVTYSNHRMTTIDIISNLQMHYLSDLLNQDSNQRIFDWTPRF